jgi:hypothetical protein
MSVHDLREHFSEALLAMRDLCEYDGLRWQAEFITLIGAWAHTRRAMGLQGDLKIDLPEPDPGEQSPAHSLLAQARLVSSVPPSSPAPGGGQRGVADGDGEGQASASPPPRPAPVTFTPPPEATPDGPGRMLGPVPKFYNTRLSGARLYQLLATGRADDKSVLVCDRSVTLDNARTRCSSMSTLCASHRLRCNLSPEGLVLIRRVLR